MNSKYLIALCANFASVHAANYNNYGEGDEAAQAAGFFAFIFYMIMIIVIMVSPCIAGICICVACNKNSKMDAEISQAIHRAEQKVNTLTQGTQVQMQQQPMMMMPPQQPMQMGMMPPQPYGQQPVYVGTAVDPDAPI